MAIKGCCRQMVVLNGTGGSVFEKAYFIVRADTAGKSKNDMMREANKIIEENCFGGAKRRKISRKTLFWIGFVCGAVLAGTVLILLRFVL